MENDGDFFWVGNVHCKSQKGWLVTVGVNLRKNHRFTVKIKVGQDREQAVREHRKYPATLEAAAAALGAPPGARKHFRALEK